MRAGLLQTDGTLRVGDIDAPRAGDGQATVEVIAAGLNPIDLIRAAAEAATADGPVVGAREGVGILDGRRVYFGSTVRPSGALTDLAVVLPERLVELPDEVDDATAIALGIAGQAAWLGLEWRARMKRGEHVLVLGSGGTVGLLGIQVARLLGAGRVIAGARSEAGRERARDLGADAVVDLSGEQGEIAERITAAADGRVDVVLDALWGEPGLAALAAASPGARVVQLGSAAGGAVPFNPAPLRGRLVDFLPFSTSPVPADVRLDAYRRSLDHAARGELAAPARELGFAEVEEAWEEQRRGPGAKLVVRLR
ncbi:MAG TPA: zinc-binding dehydrogenase [Solirubrobacterales bacterium]|jgi:NADPH2:quinone reductase